MLNSRAHARQAIHKSAVLLKWREPLHHEGFM